MSSRMSDEKGVGLKGWLAGQKSKSTRAESRADAVSLEKHRVAVLPFASITPDPSDEYFSDGMTEELISTLANVSGLQVISRTSIMQYKNTSKKAVEIGNDLAVGSIIEGSVRKAGNQLRISVQLIDTQEDKHLWAQTYDRELKDVFAMQSDIARNVSEALRVKLLPRESAKLQKTATNSMEAYTAYLKGRFHWNKRTKEAVEKAIEHLQSAINQDPNYALAYAGLADCYNVAADWGYMSPKDAYTKAKKAALKALELDSNLAEAHAALALTSEADWNWTTAEVELKRAIELNPNYASARQWYSMLLVSLGRAKEALAEARKASETDPLSPIVTFHVGWRLFQMGDNDQAIEQYKKVLEMEADFSLAVVGLAQSYAKKSMFNEARAECEKIASRISSDPYIGLLVAYVYTLCQRNDEARRILKVNLEKLEAQSPLLIEAAQVYAALGDRKKAMELLQSAYESHNPFVAKIELGIFDNLRSDAGFIELEKKMGLRK